MDIRGAFHPGVKTCGMELSTQIHYFRTSGSIPPFPICIMAYDYVFSIESKKIIKFLKKVNKI